LSIWLSLVAVVVVMVFLHNLRVQVVVQAVIATQSSVKLLVVAVQPKHQCR
jgi:hypothetical protein